MQWEYEVRIETTVSGHHVLARDIDTGRLRTVRRSRKALTWRTALVDLLEVEETWLLGDFLSDVGVSGVSGWQADMLRLAACRLDGSPSQEVQLLIKLSDLAIERFAERWGSLVTEPALNVARDLVQIHAETDATSVIEDYVLHSTPIDAKSTDAWLERLREACECNPGPGPSMAAVRSLRDVESLLDLADGPPPRSTAVRALLFRRWVELVLPIAFARTGWTLGDQPELVAAEWIVAACSKPGELAQAAESDPALKSALEKFRSAVDAFVQSVAAMPEASSYAAGIGRQLERRAATKAVKIRQQVFGDDVGVRDGVTPK